jgi:hypothetical protein
MWVAVGVVAMVVVVAVTAMPMVIMAAAAAAVVVVVTTAATVVTTAAVVCGAGGEWTLGEWCVWVCVVVWCGSLALVRHELPGSDVGVERKSRTKSYARGTWVRAEGEKRVEEVERRCGKLSAAHSLGEWWGVAHCRRRRRLVGGDEEVTG